MTRLPILATTVFALAAAFSDVSGGQTPPVSANPVFATVGNTTITAREFAAAFRNGIRQRYYHGQVPEAEIAKFQREVGERLIERALLLQETERRGIEPDAAWVAERIAALESRYKTDARWLEQREEILPRLTEKFVIDSRIEQLQSIVRHIDAPDAATLRAFYDANSDKFTEPERFRVSAILLRVAPSAAKAAWEAAMHEAQTIATKLSGGADFAGLARLHSGDGSAEQDGDMGYLHRGMLGAPAQAAVDLLKVGEITEPVRLLEGVALFKLVERPAPNLMAFDEVTDRARALWIREQEETVWRAFLDQLRTAAVIEVNEALYLPLPPGETAKM